MKFVFNDTNIYLHFRPIWEIKWLDLLNCRKVEIILPPITLKDLDKHKSTHSSDRIRKRARSILQELEQRVTRGGLLLREDVELNFLTIVPTIDYFSVGLDPEWPDDYLLATILSFKQEDPSRNVVLVSDDTGIRMKARPLGIEILELPDTYRLLNDPDPLVEENRRLKVQIAKLTSAKPDLNLNFDTGENRKIFTYPVAPPETEKERAALIAREVEKVRKEKKHRAHPLTGFTPSHPSESEIRRYNTELEDYLIEHERYLNVVTDWQFLRTKIFSITLEVVNNGGAPAEDIDVILFFSGDFELYSQDDLPEKPTPPDPPDPPMSAGDMWARRYPHRALYDPTVLSRVADLGPSPYYEKPNVTGPEIRFTNNYEVQYHVRRLKHGLVAELDPIYLDFSGSQNIESFHAEYRIIAGNIPEQIEGQIHLIMEPQS